MTPIARFEWWGVTVSPRSQWWFLRLTAADGGSGCGECSDAGTVAEVKRELFSLALLLPDDSDAALARLRARRDSTTADPRERHLVATIANAVECALEDIAARRDGVPLWRRYAPTASTGAVQLYANINRGVRERTPDGFARAALKAVDAGFSAIKCAPFDDNAPRGNTLAHAGLERLTAIRTAIGGRASLLVDAHERLPLSEMHAILPELESLEVGWLEDAVLFSDVGGLQRLKDATRIPLAGGEQALTFDEIAPVIDAGALDVVVPDVKHAGLAATLAIAGHAAAAGVRVSLHNPTGPLAAAASLHAVAAMEHSGLLEFAYDELPARGEMIAPPERLDGAMLRVPDGPGLGVSLNPPFQEERP